MNLKDYENLIVGTTENDWTKIQCLGFGSGPSYLNRFDVSEAVETEQACRAQNLEIDSHNEYMSLKKDLLVSVAWGLIANDNFKEDWVSKFPNSQAESGFTDFFYSGVLVYRDTYVSVDGGRYIVPLPQPILDSKNNVQKLVITKQQYEFFKLLNSDETSFNSCLTRAGIETINGKWMDKN
ncbi:hypothetical protein J6W78_07205 [bacterium]|nr:hypothetical protein [bacterium]